MSKITPLADRLVAVAVEAETKTASGILLPSDSQEKPNLAKVESVGKEVKEVKKGDTVIHSKFGSTEVTIDGKEYLILKEEDILGIVK